MMSQRFAKSYIFFTLENMQKMIIVPGGASSREKPEEIQSGPTKNRN